MFSLSLSLSLNVSMTVIFDDEFADLCRCLVSSRASFLTDASLQLCLVTVNYICTVFSYFTNLQFVNYLGTLHLCKELYHEII